MPDINAMDGSNSIIVEDSSKFNSTHVMEAYTLIASVAIVVPFTVLAIFTNVALLVSTRCKRSICSLQYGLVYCLAACNVVYCALWAPLDIVRILLEYLSIGMHAVTCHLDIALQYFCITVIVVIHVFLVVQHVHAISKPKDAGRDTIAVIGLVTCPLIAVGVAVVVTFQYKESSDRLNCMGRGGDTAVGGGAGDLYSVPVGVIIINVAWCLLLMLAIGELCCTLFQRRMRLAELRKGIKRRQNQTQSVKEYSTVEQSRAETSMDQDKSVSECHSSSKSPSSTRKTFADSIAQSFAKRKSSKDLRNNDDSDIDDDEYDQKMKLQLQKSLSGRRHTVANIGLGSEAPFATSSKDRFNKRSNNTDPSFNYQYVRKWSVDIQALQDQLQNPKKTNDNPFRSLTKLQGSDERSTKEPEKKKEEKVMFKEEDEIINKTSKEPNESQIIEEEEEEEEEERESENEHNGAEEVPLNKISEQQEDIECDDRDKDCGSDQDDGADGASQGLLSVDSITAPFNSATVIQNAKHGKENMEKEDEKKQLIMEEELRAELNDQIQTACACLLLVLLVLFCTMPFIVLQFLSRTSAMSLSLNRNISSVCGVVCIVQCAFHPLLIAWMQSKIWQALKRLRVKFSLLECICYCNIGKRQQCVGGSATQP